MTDEQRLQMITDQLILVRDNLFRGMSKSIQKLQARSAPVQPVAWVDLLKQAEEVVRSKSLWKKYIDGTPLANDIAVWMASFAQEHTTLPAQPAPVQPVAFEVGLVEWVGNKLMATPKTTTTPPASWMEMVTANLVREGVNKHKARELAEHFYSLAQPAPVQEPFGYGRMLWDDKLFLPTLPSVRDGGWMALYTTPLAAQRPFVGLTDEDRTEIRREHYARTLSLMDAVEAKLKEKNNG